MARHIDATPTLTPNNRIYLYQLLSSQLGCGKQTFLPAVEEALASDRMTAEDLGYENTRALLETLEEFVKLTVFKGGRIYATVIAQPEWNTALEEAAAGKPETGGKNDKPWKRKKTDKSLKPVRPKRVKKPEPEPAPEPEPQPEPEMTVEVAAETVAVVETEAIAEPEIEAAEASKSEPGTSVADNAIEVEMASVKDVAADQGSPADDMNPTSATNPEPLAETETTEPILEPAISLTVTFDPYSGIVEETKMESHPVAPAPVAEPKLDPVPTPAPTPDPVPVPEPMPEPEPMRPIVSPEVLATYPVDFATEVYLDSERIGELCELLPYGTDVFKLLAEDYTRARNLELISGTRARATFPLRIQHIDSTEPLTITLKKRSGSGLKWELQSVE